MALSVFNSVFILGQIAEMTADWVSGKPWWSDMPQFPVFDLTKDVLKQFEKGRTLKDPEKAREAYMQGFMALLPLTKLGGMPTTIASLPLKTLERMADNYTKIIQDGGDPKEIFLRMFNYSDYYIEPRTKPKKEKKTKLRQSEIKKYLPELYEAQQELKNDPDYKEYQQQMKEFKKEKEAMREQFLKEMYDD